MIAHSKIKPALAETATTNSEALTCANHSSGLSFSKGEQSWVVTGPQPPPPEASMKTAIPQIGTSIFERGLAGDGRNDGEANAKNKVKELNQVLIKGLTYKPGRLKKLKRAALRLKMLRFHRG